jgi:hypothetical protein
LGSKDKGLRAVKAGSLELKWGFLATEEFEAEARKYLKGEKAILERALPGASDIVSKFATDSRIIMMALEAATGKDRAEIAEVIDREGISREKLFKCLFEALMQAEDPSRAAYLKKKWQLSDELLEKERAAEMVEMIDETIAELTKKKKSLILSGVAGSPSSSSASSPETPPT